MKQYVLITGTGREMALGFNFVRRYLEQGDHVFACVRKPSEALEKIRQAYPETLTILEMDIGSTASVNAAACKAAEIAPCLDLLINNAVTTSPDTNKELEAIHGSRNTTKNAATTPKMVSREPYPGHLDCNRVM